MKKFLSCIILSFFCFIAFAQLKPDYFPEEIPEGLTPASCIFCKPGVKNKSRSRGIEIGYGFTPRSTFNSENTELGLPLPSFDNLGYFLLDLKVPVIIKDHFNFLLSYKFTREKYNIHEAGSEFASVFSSLDQNSLKSNSIGFILSKSFNEVSYLALQGKFTASGNYRGWMEFRNRSAMYKFRAIYGFKKHDDMEWGIGLSLTKSFRRTSFIPFLVFNKNFKHHWGVEAILPAVIFVRYNLDERNILLFGPQYSSRSYRFFTEEDNPINNLDYAINQSKLITSFRWERQIVPWVWAHLQLGYQINFASDFESKNTLPSFDADPSDAPYFQFSVFVSPPRD